MPTPESINFAKNYQILQDGVEKLRRSRVADIDTLVDLTKSVSEAHAACRARIAQISEMVRNNQN